MKKNIKVSVIMPAYNAENTIEKSIGSVLTQSYSNIELIVIDDGSKDNTIEIAKKNNDNRLKIIVKENEGPSIARNKGLEVATGDYIMFLDADDRLEANIIKKLVSILNKKNYDVVLFKTVYEQNGVIEDRCNFESFEFEQDDIKLLNNSIYNKFEKYNNILCFDGVSGKIINKNLVLNNNIKFPENTFRFEDAIFCKKIYKIATKIYFLSDIGAYYVKNENSICHKYNPKICEAVYNALTLLYELTSHKQNFYIKSITSLSECEVLYFLNKSNRKNNKQIRFEFKQMLNRPLYRETLNFIDIKKIPLTYKIEVFLLKKGFISVYLFFKKLYFFLKNK